MKSLNFAYWLTCISNRLSRKSYAKQLALKYVNWKIHNLYGIPGYARKSESELYDIFISRNG